jgi:hypothetical protein
VCVCVRERACVLAVVLILSGLLAVTWYAALRVAAADAQLAIC